jgi:uncharacterized protein
MGTRTSYAPGTFSWVDLQSTDVDGAKRFYNALFGWEYEDMPLGDGSFFTFVNAGDGRVCGMSGLAPGTQIPPHWNSYVTVASADETAARVQEAGGTVIEQPFDVFTAGRMALFSDPTGGYLCVWEPRETIGATRVNDPGCLCWNELGTQDPATAASFFEAVFGWTYNEADIGADEPYRVILNGGNNNGGIRKQTQMEAGIPPNWLPFFTVEDAAAATATVSSSGGRVLVEPYAVPMMGDALIAVYLDNAGAPFAVFQGETDE